MVENVPEGEHMSHWHFFFAGVPAKILLKRRGTFRREMLQMRFKIILIEKIFQEIPAPVCPMDHVLLESAAHDNNRIRRGPYGHDAVVLEVKSQFAFVCAFAVEPVVNLLYGSVHHPRLGEAVLGGANPKDAVP